MPIQDSMTVFSICACVSAAVFWTTHQSWASRLYSVVPSVVFVYYIPAILSSVGILPGTSPAYDWMREFLLPFSLFVLMITTDVPAVLKIGPKAIAMMLVGTLGVVLGGPLAYLLLQSWLPADSWKALAALSGSWIGGGGNFAAIKEAVGASDDLIGPIIVVDVAVGYSWTGVLLFLSAYQRRFDQWNRAGSEVIEALNRRLERFKQTSSRSLELLDVSATIAVGFLGTVVCRSLGTTLFDLTSSALQSKSPSLAAIFSPFTWMIILITTLGILLSFTGLRQIERGGSSKIGFAALYIFLASLGAKANLMGLLEAPILVVTGIVWILVHVIVLFVGARLLRAPLFLLAVGSQANIGGAATAPIVAAAYYESLAPVGVLMGILGYLVGNYAGLLCALLLRLAS